MSSSQQTDSGRTIDWSRGHDRTPTEDREPYPGDLAPTRKESFQSVVDELNIERKMMLPSKFDRSS